MRPSGFFVGAMSPLKSLLNEYRDAARAFSRPARLFLLCDLLVWTAAGVHQVLYNLYLVEGGYQEGFVGHAISMNAIGLALTALPAGVLADRWGRRKTLLLGVAFEAGGLLLRSILLIPGTIYAGSLLAGAGQALILITAAPFITEHSTARERTHLFTTFFAVSLSAGVVGSLMGGLLPWLLLALPDGFAPSTLVAYRITLIAGAVASVTALLPLIRMGDLRETPAASESEPIDPESRSRLFPIALNAFLIGAGAGLVIPFMNLYFVRRFDCSSAQIGSFYSVAQIVTAMAALLGPPISRRYGKLRTATALELASVPFLVTLGAESRLSIAVGAFWLRAMLMQASTPLHQAFIMEVLPRRLRARSMSINSALWHIGWATSAALAGLLIERFGYAIPFYVTAVLYSTAAITMFLAFRRVREPVAAQVPAGEAAATRPEGGIIE
jgi:MFS family permease